MHGTNTYMHDMHAHTHVQDTHACTHTHTHNGPNNSLSRMCKTHLNGSASGISTPTQNFMKPKIWWNPEYTVTVEDGPPDSEERDSKLQFPELYPLYIAALNYIKVYEIIAIQTSAVIRLRMVYSF